MATVCGGALSMMDAGLQITAPVAGVAMGLVMEEDGDYVVLTDIMGFIAYTFNTFKCLAVIF